MKKSRWADWFLTAGFLGFLALALAVTLIRPKSGWSYYENRNLAHPAELSVETLLDGTFPASVEPVLQDHAAGRNTLMKLSVWVDLHLFHRPVVNQVVPADGMLLGWNPYETPDPAGITAQAEHMAEELARLRDVVEEYGGTSAMQRSRDSTPTTRTPIRTFSTTGRRIPLWRSPPSPMPWRNVGWIFWTWGRCWTQLVTPGNITPWPTTTISSAEPISPTGPSWSASARSWVQS